SRPDAIEHLKLPTASPWCGFTVDLRVPPGRTNLRLEVQTATGLWRKAAGRTLQGPWFSSQTRKEWKATTDAADVADAAARYLWCFDRPTDWARPVRTLYILGWCIDLKQEQIEGIRARIGNRVFPGKYGFARQDVAAEHPESPFYMRSGLAIAIPLRPGKVDLILECKSSGEHWRPFFRQRVCGAKKDDPPDEPLPFAGYFRFDPRVSLRIQYW